MFPKPPSWLGRGTPSSGLTLGGRTTVVSWGPTYNRGRAFATKAKTKTLITNGNDDNARHQQLSNFHGSVVDDRDVIARAPRLLLDLFGPTDQLIYLLQSTSASISTRKSTCSLDPIVDRWSRSSRSKIGQVELIEKSSTSRSSRSSRVDFSTSRVDRLVDD